MVSLQLARENKHIISIHIHNTELYFNVLIALFTEKQKGTNLQNDNLTIIRSLVPFSIVTSLSIKRRTYF